MNRNQAFELLKNHIKNNNLIKHSLAVEALMKGLARYFKEDEEKWGITGILHDIDYEKVKDDLSQHSLLGSKIIKDLGFEDDICKAVRSHNEAHGISPENLLGKALFVSDPLSGLIIASALVLPSKKLADLKTETILKKFKEKSFARGANREIIIKCHDYLNLNLEEFINIGLKSLQEISKDLDL